MIGENSKTLRADHRQEFQPFGAHLMSALNKILAKRVSSDSLNRIQPKLNHLIFSADAVPSSIFSKISAGRSIFLH